MQRFSALFLLSALALTGCPGTSVGTDSGSPRIDSGPLADLGPRPDGCVSGPENSAALCSDGCDNDGNNFLDCADFACAGLGSCPTRPDAGFPPATTVTIQQLQDPTAAGHPAPSNTASIEITETGLVAITPRTLVSSGTTCRFAVWVGKPAGGDFSAIQVQEVVGAPDSGTCFDVMTNRIPTNIQIGDPVESIRNAVYDEFCTVTPAPTSCVDFAQSQVVLRFGTSAIIPGTPPGTQPTPTTVTVADVLGAGSPPVPTARGRALESTLVRVTGVNISAANTDAGFTSISVTDASDAARARPLDIQVANIPNANCARMALIARNGQTGSFTGILYPNFGRWTLRVRSTSDIDGVVCGGDGGVDGGATVDAGASDAGPSDAGAVDAGNG